MSSTDFDINHVWQLQARPEELTAIILDTTSYKRWCARILLNCEIVNKGDRDGRGLALRVHTKGWLPYSFLFHVDVVDLEPHQWMKVRVSGDFEGICDLRVVASDDKTTRLTLRWLVDLHHPVLRRLKTPLYRIMVVNHTWAVNWIRRMMQRELDRRREGKPDAEVPPPTFRGFLRFQTSRHQSRARAQGWQAGLKGPSPD